MTVKEIVPDGPTHLVNAPTCTSNRLETQLPDG